LKPDFATRFKIHAIKKKHVKVDIQIQGGSKTLDQRDRAGMAR
jgi:hypothetical protein